MKVQLGAAQTDEFGMWILEIGKVKLGLSPQFSWCLRWRDDTRNLIETQDMTLLLPLLEFGRQPLYSHLQTISNERPLIADKVMEFPEELLLRCAFETSVSDYWPLKGLEWLALSPGLIGPLADVVREMQKHSWVTQLLKRKVKAVLRRTREDALWQELDVASTDADE